MCSSDLVIEQGPQHARQVRQVHRAIGQRRDVVVVGHEPARQVGELEVGRLVRQAQQTLRALW